MDVPTGEQRWRRRPTQTRRNTRRIAAACTAALLVAVAGWHYWALYDDLSAAKTDLLAAKDGVAAAGFDAQRGDLAATRERLDRADGHITAARRHLRWDPLLRAARPLPVVGDQVDALSRLAGMAATLTEIGQLSVAAGDRIVTFRESPADGTPLSQSLVQLLDDTGPEVRKIERLTQELVASRLALGDRELAGPLAAARDRLDGELPGLANTVEQLARTRELLPAFLGFESERRYLVLALNNGELFPGGGLVSATGVMPISLGEPGEVDFTDSTRWKWAWEAKGGSYIEPPGPLKRYLLQDFTWNLLVADWDPDFPTWSQQALEFYELIHGEQQVDGIIAVDLAVLQRLLVITGPRTLEVEGHGAVTFTGGNAVLELERLTRQAFEQTDDRKSVIGDLAQLLMSDLQSLPPEKWEAAVKTIRALGSERHIQVLSFHPAEQTLIRDAGWDGALRQAKGDFLHLAEASVNSTKLNLIIAPEAVYQVEIDRSGTAHHSLALHYRNTLPEWSNGKDPRLVKQLMLGGLYGGYLRVFTPRGMVHPAVAVNGSAVPPEDYGTRGSFDWFGAFFSLPSGKEAAVALSWAVPNVATGAAANDYSLTIQKQPGTAGMCIDLKLTREGAAPGRLVVEGGRRDPNGRICLVEDVTIRAWWPAAP